MRTLRFDASRFRDSTPERDAGGTNGATRVAANHPPGASYDSIPQMGKHMFRYMWVLLTVTFAAGCASMQAKFCNLIDPDSYVLVSAAGCETVEVSFDYEAEETFSTLESYGWLAAPDTASVDPGNEGGNQLDEWVMDAVDAKLAEQGFKLTSEAPDFLVSYEVPFAMRGTLTLTLIGAGSRQPIWRGTATDEAYQARDVAAWEKRIRFAVDRLLEQFPPPPNE